MIVSYTFRAFPDHRCERWLLRVCARFGFGRVTEHGVWSPCLLDDVEFGGVSFVEWDVYWSGNRVFHSCTDCDVISVHDSTLSSNFNVIIVELWRREWDGFWGVSFHWTSSLESAVFDVESGSIDVDLWGERNGNGDMADVDFYTICTLLNKIGSCEERWVELVQSDEHLRFSFEDEELAWGWGEWCCSVHQWVSLVQINSWRCLCR